MSTQKYIDKIKKRKGLQREPISEQAQEMVIQDHRNHTHIWDKEKKQTHPTLTSYVCTVGRCGAGRMIDEKVDSIDNY